MNQRFCFVLGAGASYNCGIAKASDLIDEWYGELLEDYCSSDQWKKILSKGRDEALNDTINALKNDEENSSDKFFLLLYGTQIQN